MTIGLGIGAAKAKRLRRGTLPPAQPEFSATDFSSDFSIGAPAAPADFAAADFAPADFSTA